MIHKLPIFFRLLTFFLITPLAFLFFSAGCGPAPEPCNPCEDIGGKFTVDHIQLSNSCDFQPVLISDPLEFIQSGDTQKITSEFTDPVSGYEIVISGDVYSTIERDPKNALARFQMQTQLLRPATVMSPDIITLRVNLSGIVSRVEGRKEISGSLNSSNVTPGQADTCWVKINFTAIEKSDDVPDDVQEED